MGLRFSRPQVSRLFIVLGFVTGVMASGYGVMFTVLDDFRDEFNISSGNLGIVVGTGFLAGFGSQVLLGPLADRGHARKLVIIGTLITFAGTVGLAFGTSLLPLLAGRFFMGIGIGMANPAIRRILILAEPEKIGQNLGRLLSIDVAGFALGPVVSALTVGTFGLKAPFLLIAALTLLVVPFIARTHVNERDISEMPSERFAFDLLKERPILGAMCFGIAVFLMIGTFDSMWSLVMDDMKAPEWMANVGITIFALPLIIIGPYGGRIVQKHGPFRLAAGGLTIGSLCIAGYGLLGVPWMMLVLGAFHGMNDALTVSGAGVGVGMVSPPHRQAGAQGLLGGAQTLAGGLAAIGAGRSYEHFGRAPTFLACTVLMLALVAAGSVLCGPAMHQRDRRTSTDSEHEPLPIPV
jgi:MFS family permease